MPWVLGRLKVLDAYPKVHDDFFTKTMSGGIITLAAAAIMLLLFLSELSIYLVPKSVHELTVDISRGEAISIELDVTFPHMPCSWLSLDAMDVSGEQHLDLDEHEVFKQRLSAAGYPFSEAERHDVHTTKKMLPPLQEGGAAVPGQLCLTCYGAEEAPGGCCNTCDEVRAAYRKKGWAIANLEDMAQCMHDVYIESVKEQRGEGCRMWGTIKVNKVAGNFHFAPGRSYDQGGVHAHDISPFGRAPLDFTHTIHKLAFGRSYPGMRNPLDGVRAKLSAKKPVPGDSGGMFQYFLKVVPTEYSYLNNQTISTNQFSVTENFRELQAGARRNLPGIFFFYDLSPIKVKISEVKPSFLHFLTNVCAIVGGVFTVSGIIDAFVYQSERMIRKKVEMGKLY